MIVSADNSRLLSPTSGRLLSCARWAQQHGLAVKRIFFPAIRKQLAADCFGVDVRLGAAVKWACWKRAVIGLAQCSAFDDKFRRERKISVGVAGIARSVSGLDTDTLRGFGEHGRHFTSMRYALQVLEGPAA